MQEEKVIKCQDPSSPQSEKFYLQKVMSDFGTLFSGRCLTHVTSHH